MEDLKFYLCEHCGNIAEKIVDKGVPLVCCGQEMLELVPGTTDGAAEKHVPVYTVDGNTVTVQVGSEKHPMLPEHFIEWIVLQTKQGYQRKKLNPGEEPVAVFTIADGDEVEAVYEYCNLHRLWKA